jgi:hypothetical protein
MERMSATAVIRSMIYLSFWHAFTYRKAMAKNAAVKNNIVRSRMETLTIWRSVSVCANKEFES